MSALLRFLVRFSSFFEFLFLEVIAFLLILNFNAFQQTIVYKFNSSIVASIYSATNACADYFHLTGENERLLQENSQLLNRIAALEAQLSDTAQVGLESAEYKTYSAKVVYGSVNRLQNILVLNKGSKDGIAVDMGVVNADGAVGIVDAVTSHYAVVTPIINTKSLTSAKIAKNGYIGSISWNGLSPEYADLVDIPYHVDVVEGDTIVTSGYSSIFNSDIPIGIVDDVEVNNSEIFCKIRVHLLVNYRTINTVHVIDFAHRDELNEVIKQAETVKE